MSDMFADPMAELLARIEALEAAVFAKAPKPAIANGPQQGGSKEAACPMEYNGGIMFKAFGKNLNGSDYVVGDIHGCFTMLQTALARIGFDPDKDRLFSVGDMVDRGPESEAVIDWLRKPWFYAVRGNHEQMCIEADPGMHLINGGAWFVGMVNAEQAAIRDEFSALPIAIEVETDCSTVGIVHAEVPGDDWAIFRGWLLDGGISFEHLERFALWGRDLIRGRSGFAGVEGIGLVCVGHTPLKEPSSLHNVMYLDTGACFGKTMTIACIHGPKAGQIFEASTWTCSPINRLLPNFSLA